MPDEEKKLSLWVIYDHPRDLPHWFIARRFEADQPTRDMLYAHDLDFLRQRLSARGLVCIPRDESDHPVVVETWL